MYTVRNIIDRTSDDIYQYSQKNKCLQWIKQFENNCYYDDNDGNSHVGKMNYAFLEFAVRTDIKMRFQDAMEDLKYKTVEFIEEFFCTRDYNENYCYEYISNAKEQVDILENNWCNCNYNEHKVFIDRFCESEYVPQHKDFLKYIEGNIKELNDLADDIETADENMETISVFRQKIINSHIADLDI